ncbi:MAG: FecR family protein [Bacteroidales bacterium]
MENIKESIRKGKELFKQICNKSDLSNVEGYVEWHLDYNRISTSNAWIKMWYKYNKKYIYSVASIFVLFLCWQIFIPEKQSENIYLVEAPAILPASNSIVLRVSSGESVIIDSISKVDSMFNGVDLFSGEIVYSGISEELVDSKQDDRVDDESVKDESVKKSNNLKYNELYVPKGRVFSVILSDGSKVWLNSESYLKYPVNFGSNDRSVYLSGEAYFEVSKNKSKFTVKTSSYSVNVLGTKFNTRAYENDYEVSTTLVEGSVSLETDPTSEFRISPGEQFVMQKNTGSVTVNKVDVHLFTSWINNQLILRKNTLEEIFKVLMRKYDIDVFYRDEKVKYETYSGDIPLNENLNVILEQISKVSDVDFEIEGQIIIARYR